MINDLYKPDAPRPAYVAVHRPSRGKPEVAAMASPMPSETSTPVTVGPLEQASVPVSVVQLVSSSEPRGSEGEAPSAGTQPQVLTMPCLTPSHHFLSSLSKRF